MSQEQYLTMMIYNESLEREKRSKQLVVYPDTMHEKRFTFYKKIEIGRYREERKKLVGVLLIMDPTVSSQHCTITQLSDGRCYIRDTSRNGTRLDGKRLVPNVEVEVKMNQVIGIGNRHEFLLVGESSEVSESYPTMGIGGTMLDIRSMNVTVLVGDIRDYTGLVQRPDTAAVQQAIRRVFHKLEEKVTQFGGTIKEFHGDAIFAYWEANLSENQAVDACRAVLSLDQFSRQLARDDSIWNIPDFPLQLDWALATGQVTIDTIGEDRPTGLSVIGVPVVLAFRIEKFANDETGPIVVCPKTQAEASAVFKFKDLGERYSKGFDEASRIFALIGLK